MNYLCIFSYTGRRNFLIAATTLFLIFSLSLNTEAQNKTAKIKAVLDLHYQMYSGDPDTANPSSITNIEENYSCPLNVIEINVKRIKILQASFDSRKKSYEQYLEKSPFILNANSWKNINGNESSLIRGNYIRIDKSEINGELKTTARQDLNMEINGYYITLAIFPIAIENSVEFSSRENPKYFAVIGSRTSACYYQNSDDCIIKSRGNGYWLSPNGKVIDGPVEENIKPVEFKKYDIMNEGWIVRPLIIENGKGLEKYLLNPRGDFTFNAAGKVITDNLSREVINIKVTLSAD